MLEHDVQYSTNKGYKSSFKQYQRFCKIFNIPPLPVTQLTTLYWLAFRTTEVKASSALTNYYGMKKIAMYHGYPVSDKNWEFVQSAKRTMKKEFGANTPDVRKPATFEFVETIYPYFNMNNYNDLVFFVTIVCAVTGLMRTSEIYAKNKKVSPHAQTKASVKALWNRNLKAHFNADKTQLTHYTCTIRDTKTEKGHCDVDVVWAKGKFPVSPADLLTNYLNTRIQLQKTNKQLSSQPTAPLFQLLDGTIVTSGDIRKRWDILCAKMGLDTKIYTIYSFRIGGATSLARRGVDHRIIQIAGRWTSDAYALYIRMTSDTMAKHQHTFLNADVTHPDLIFAHENIPQNLLVKA